MHTAQLQNQNVLPVDTDSLVEQHSDHYQALQDHSSPCTNQEFPIQNCKLVSEHKMSLNASSLVPLKTNVHVTLNIPQTCKRLKLSSIHVLHLLAFVV